MRVPLLARTWDFLVGSKTRRAARPRPAGLSVLSLEDRITPDGRPLPLPFTFVGAASGTPLVRAYKSETGELAFERQPFDSAFTGGVRVAAGDINHDGIPDLIAAAGAGGGPAVKVYDGKSGDLIAGSLGSFYAYDPGFTGGVFVASGDVDGDGWADLITAAGAGGTPHVKVFSGSTEQLLASFYAFDTAFRGGATVASADFTGDGKADLVIGAGAGGGPNVRVFDLSTGQPLMPPLGSFYAFDASFTGGVDVGTDYLTGDVTGDSVPDIVVGQGPGGGLVRVFDGASGSQVREIAPFGSGATMGVRVATAFVDDDKYADIIAATGAGVTAQVRTFSGLTGVELASPMSPLTPFGSSFTGGLFVAASNDPDQVIMYFNGGTTFVGGPLSLAAEVWDQNMYNGLQQPTGTITFRTTVNGTLTTLGASSLVGYDTGKSRATLTVNPVILPAGTYSVQATYTPSNAFLADFRNAMLQVQPLSGDLDIIDSNGVEVADAKESSPGGWVPVNNDNDNYNFVGDAAAQPTSVDQKWDKDESAKVVGENDLVEIRVHDLVGTGWPNEEFTLSWAFASRIKVWKTQDKDGAVMSGVVVPMGKATSYWVEGLSLSSAVADQPITLEYRTPNVGPITIDEVLFTVYQLDGVLNVPGYSIHKYQVRTPSQQPEFTPGVVSVSGGQKQTEFAGGTSGGTGTTMQATVLWDAGPVVGKVRVTPGTAVSNFFIDREVNVVKIAFSPGGADNKLVFTNPPFQDADVKQVIRSATGVGAKQAMTATLKVTHVEGPIVIQGGFQRGVRFMEYGFIQNVTISQMHADYDDFATGKRQRANTLEGRSYLDGDAAPNPEEPWYHTVGGLESPDDPVGQGNLVPAATLSIYDSPGLAATDVMTLTVAGPNGQGAPLTDYVDRYWITLDFSLYFAARTLEESLDSQLVYTQRASAYWTFDGSGTINQGNPNNNFAGKGTWEQADQAMNGMTCPDCNAEFVEVNDGSVVPITSGPTANHVVLNPNDYDAYWFTRLNPN